MNARDGRGRTPLYFAAGNDDLAVVSALVEAGFDPNARDEKSQMSKMVSAIVEAGFDPNTRDGRGRTLLHFAAGNGNLGLVSALIEAGADPNVQNQEGQTPRDLAQRYDDAFKGTDAWLLLNEGQS